MGIFTPDEHGHTADQDACPDRDDDQIQRRGLPERPDRKTLKSDTDSCGGCNGENSSRYQRHIHESEEEKGQHPAEHHKLPLGKVDDPGSVVDDGEAKTDQSVDGTIREAG